jgi:hypothetical protein
MAVESELQEQFGPSPPAEPLSHSDSLPLPPIDALDFSQPARGNFANTAVGVLSALLATGPPSAFLDFAAPAFQPEPLIPSP